jgi:hypothetical protein
MKSAFDEEEEYELTELGTQFVRYTMDEVMPRIGEACHTGKGGSIHQPPSLAALRARKGQI